MFIGQDKNYQNKANGVVGGVYVGNRSLGAFSDTGMNKEFSSREWEEGEDTNPDFRKEPELVFELARIFQNNDNQFTDPAMFTWSTASVLGNTVYFRRETQDDQRESSTFVTSIDGAFSVRSSTLLREYTSNAVELENRYIGVVVRVGNTSKLGANGDFYIDNFNINQQDVDWYFDSGNGYEKVPDFYDGGKVTYTLSDTKSVNTLGVKAHITGDAWVSDIIIAPNTGKKIKSSDLLDFSVEYTARNEYTFTPHGKVYVFYYDQDLMETYALSDMEINLEETGQANDSGWGYTTDSVLQLDGYDARYLSFLFEGDGKYSRVWRPENVLLLTNSENENDYDVYICGREVVIPDCEFVAPSGKEFTGWEVDSEIIQPGEVRYINRGKLVARWE